jgi:hypothetical protein
MRFLTVATATLGLLLLVAPGLRAQDDDKPKTEKKDEKKKDDDKKDEKKKDDDSDDDDDKPKKPLERLPINPFAKAKKGDWSWAVGRIKAAGMNEKMKFVVKVTEVTDDEVTISMKQSGGFGPGQEKTVTFSKKEMPSYNKFFEGKDDSSGGGPSDWKVEDDKKTIGGKEFPCKKASAKFKEKERVDAKVTLWITDQTKGWGLLGMSITGTEMGQKISMDFELKGYGNGDTADFGKKADEDKADDEGDKDDDDAPKKDKDKKDDAPKDEKKDDKK